MLLKLETVTEATFTEHWLLESVLAEPGAYGPSGIHRLLDPENDAVTLSTLRKAVSAVGPLSVGTQRVHRSQSRHGAEQGGLQSRAGRAIC